MKYFVEEEFLGYYGQMSPKLLGLLDDLREYLGCALNLSKSPVGMARHLGESSTSQHNVDMWGECRAVDGYIPEDISYQEFYTSAKKVGFTGIGVYTGWNGGRGFHVDVRADRAVGHPATWAGIYDKKTGKTKYTNIWELITGESNGIIRA